MSALSSPSPVRAPQRRTPAIVPPPPKKPKYWLFGLVFLVVAAGVIGAIQLLNRPSQPSSTVAAARTVKAFVGPLDVTLRMAGTAAARNFGNITVPVLRGPEMRDSLVLLETARPGSFVRKGDVVVRIDAQPTLDHIDDVKDDVAAAENQVRKRGAEQKVEWENLQQTLRVAKAELDKARLDYSAAEVRTDVERELLKLALDESEARYKQQLRDGDFRKASQAAELRTLEIELEREKRHIARHYRDAERLTIKAPIDGLVVMSTIRRGGELAQVQAGDQVFPGQRIMQVVDVSDMQVEGSVSQTDSADLRLGQVANVGFDAFKDLKFDGKVATIGALAVGGWRQNDYIRTVPVRVSIRGADPRLIPDLSAHCDIVLERLPNQVQVPASALEAENGSPYVKVKLRDRVERRQVKVGKRSNTHVAILSGLEAGEEVLVD